MLLFTLGFCVKNAFFARRFCTSGLLSAQVGLILAPMQLMEAEIVRATLAVKNVSKKCLTFTHHRAWTDRNNEIKRESFCPLRGRQWSIRRIEKSNSITGAKMSDGGH